MKTDVIETDVIYSPGAVERKEDGYVSRHPFYCVMDGTSEPYSPNHPQSFIANMSLGEFTVRIIEDEIMNSPSSRGLGVTLPHLNKLILAKKMSAGISEEGALLSGATFAGLKVSHESLEIITLGDAHALISLKNGKVHLSKNQVRAHDHLMHEEIARLMEQVASERGINLAEAKSEDLLRDLRREMWDRFRPYLSEARFEHINNLDEPEGYGLLNGDIRVEKMWRSETFQREEVDRVMLFTDNLIAWSIISSIDPENLGVFILELYKRSGFRGILDVTRSAEIAQASKSHITHAEATAIALRFV